MEVKVDKIDETRENIDIRKQHVLNCFLFSLFFVHIDYDILTAD